MNRELVNSETLGARILWKLEFAKACNLVLVENLERVNSASLEKLKK